MSVIGPIDILKWNTLKKLKVSIDSKDTKPKRLEREKFLFQFILDQFKEVA